MCTGMNTCKLSQGRCSITTRNLHGFTNNTSTIFCSLAEHHLLLAKRTIHCHWLTSANTHITALLEEKEPFSSPVLLFCLPFSCLRLFIQELKVKVYLCLSQCVSMVLSIYALLPSITLPFYHLPSLPLSSSLLGRGKIHETCDVSWKSREQSGTEQSVSLSVCMSHAAATVKRQWKTERKCNRVSQLKRALFKREEKNKRHHRHSAFEAGHLE